MRITIAILLAITTQFLSATPQVSDYLIYEGKTMPIFSNPLENYLELKGLSDIDRGCNSSSCWRGYIATWELKNNKLFLVKVEYCGVLQSAGVYTGLDCDQNKTSDILTFLNNTFNSKSTFASWFSGNLIAPQGRLIEYIHSGYESVFEKEQYFEISKGNLVKTKTVRNKIKPELYETYNRSLVRDTLLHYISKLDWNHLEEEYYCQDYYSIRINKKGKVTKVWYESYFDSKWDKLWYNLNDFGCRRRVRRSIKHIRFNKYLMGDFKELVVELELFDVN